uniref:Putative secreted protein n=1 Tax=Anopheles darlingi TaxID=43151 RepID=A0A2M4DFZ5_ANODA
MPALLLLLVMKVIVCLGAGPACDPYRPLRCPSWCGIRSHRPNTPPSTCDHHRQRTSIVLGRQRPAPRCLPRSWPPEAFLPLGVAAHHSARIQNCILHWLHCCSRNAKCRA